MSSLRFEPAPGPTRFSCLPLGSGQAGDWIGRWANGRSATIVVNIAGLDSKKREFDIVVREKLPSTPASLLRHTYVQIFESQSAASPFPQVTDHQPGHAGTPDERVRTLLLPEHGIHLGLYMLVDQQPGQLSGPYCRIIRYRRPATSHAPAADLMLRQTPRVD